MDKIYKIYLMPNGELTAIAQEKSDYYDSKSYQPIISVSDEALVLEEICYGEEHKKESLAFWQKNKDYFSVHHYSTFYLFNKIQKLEEKLEKVTKHLSKVL